LNTTQNARSDARHAPVVNLIATTMVNITSIIKMMATTTIRIFSNRVLRRQQFCWDLDLLHADENSLLTFLRYRYSR